MTVSITAKENALSLYKPSIDLGGSFIVQLNQRYFCGITTTAPITRITDCKGHTQLFFELPCLDAGDYILKLLDSSSMQVLATFTAFYK